jgi:transposase
VVAVAHSLLVSSYDVAARRAEYREPGGDYFDRRHRQTQQQRLVKKLEAMGMKVTVEALPKAA